MRVVFRSFALLRKVVRPAVPVQLKLKHPFTTGMHDASICLSEAEGPRSRVILDDCQINDK